MIYLKVVPEKFQNASRDKRELSVAKVLGYEVHVIEGSSCEKNFDYICEGYAVSAIATQTIGNVSWLHKRVHWNGVKAFCKFIVKVWETEADIISGHDWFCLLASYIANLFKQRKAKLIYDSHEFELYQNPSRSKVKLWILKLVEGFLIKRVDLALMVGDKIADGVQEIYHLKIRPTVVRNIPTYWHLEPEKSAIIRRHFLEKLGLPDTGFLLMYHGGVMPGRGIESAIRALPLLQEDTGFIILGYENLPGVIESLRGLAEEKGVAHRVFFHAAVLVAELKDYIGAVDLELVLIEGKYCLSYEYSLPNKFFESIQACVPMICSDLPEIGKIVRQYDVGQLVEEDDEGSIAEAVLKLRNDKMLYNRLKKNMEQAKEELCWEKESMKLKAAIREMMRKVK